MAELARRQKTEQRLERLSDALRSGRVAPVQRLINTLPPAEIADLLESLPPAQRQVAWELVDADYDGEVLVHVADDVRPSLIDVMDEAQLVEATSDLDLDDLVDILDHLPDPVSNQIVQLMDREDQERLEQMRAYPEDSAGGLLNPEVVTVRADVSLDVVIRYLRMRGELPALMDHLYVVDRDGKYAGSLPISKLLTEDPEQLVSDVITVSHAPVQVSASSTDVAAEFEHKDWVSAPVVDEHHRLLGRITIDDIVDVIRDEAEHSVMSMAGLDEEQDMFAPVIASSRRRAIYLGFNLITALFAAFFIKLFDGTIEQVVALAVLMPVVASMGGIAGTQTLTLMVRGMAVGQIGAGNTRPLLGRELAIGGINGAVWAAVMAVVAVLVWKQPSIGIVAACAILINMVAGALAGVLVPLLLRRMQIDPALAGGMLLTTITDVVGFVTLLGLGTLFVLGQ